MDDFLDDVLADSSVGRMQCRVGALYGDDPELGEKVKSALENPEATCSAISRKLASMGVKVTAASVPPHRRGECSCG